MKKIVSVFISLITLLLFSNVSAGNVTISFQGDENIPVGTSFDVYVKAEEIEGLNGGLATCQGDIVFDSSYLEYKGFQDVSDKLSVSYGVKTKRFVALGMNGEYISGSGNLLKLTFKALKTGSTTINIINTVVGDEKAITHGAVVNKKNINIIEENKDNSQNNTPSNSNDSPKKAPIKAPSNNSNKTSSIKSSDATLSSLIVNSAKMSPEFNKNINTYNVEVTRDTSKLDLDYKTSNIKAKVKIDGNLDIKDVERATINVIVTSEDGSTNTYTLNIVKAKEKNENKLESLEIKEAKIPFDEDNYEYDFEVKSNVKELTIDAIPKSKDSKVEIIGNSNLEKGDNTVLIKLTDKDGYVSFYKLNVKRGSTIKIFGIDLKTILYFIFMFLIILLLFLILLLIILIVKKRKNKNNNNRNNGDTIVMRKEDLEKLRNHKSHFKDESENVDVYDDVVTKDELIDAIEEKNPKKLKMLLAQDEANRLKEELKNEENNNK